MKKTSCFVCLMVFLAFMSACKGRSGKAVEEKSEEIEFHEIDLSKDFTGSTCDNLLLSDIVEDVEYVQLETTDECLIDNFASYTITDKGIYVLNKKYTKEEVFRFDRVTGKFIKQIGHTGQGPQDMLHPSYLYAEDSLLYISSNVTDKVYVYDNNGKYIRTVPLPEETFGEEITVIKDKYIICHPGKKIRTDANDNMESFLSQYISVAILDMDGKELFLQNDTLQGAGLPDISLDWNPKRWYHNNQLNYYNEVDATVYAVNENGIKPRYKFNLGKNRWIVAGKAAKKHMEYIKFHYIRETNDYLFIYWNQNQKPYFAYFDKKSGNLDVQEQKVYKKGRFWHLLAYGPQNDIDGCGNYFGPGNGAGNILGSIVFVITPDNIDRVREDLGKAENVKFPEKRQQLLKMLDERKEDDNPILVIYKLKK